MRMRHSVDHVPVKAGVFVYGYVAQANAFGQLVRHIFRKHSLPMQQQKASAMVEGTDEDSARMVVARRC